MSFETALASTNEITDDTKTLPLPKRGVRWLALLRQPLTACSLIWLLTLVVVSILATWVAPMNPIQQNLGNALALPDASHLLGTDQLGRDVLSRLIHGGGATLLGALQAVAIAIAVGTPLGMAAGYFGGWFDNLAARLADLLMIVPGIIVLLTFLALFGGSMAIAMTSLGVLLSAGFLRLARSAAQSIRSELYVDAAVVSGLRSLQVLWRHIAPHVLSPIIVLASVSLGAAILTQAGLGFLGLGPPPPTPNWGQMIAEASQLMSSAPWLMVPPGIVIVLTVMALNFIGDGVRDALPQTGRPDLLTPTRFPTKARGAAPSNESEGRAAVPTPSEALLTVENLTVSFGDDRDSHVVVDDVSFELRKGEALGIVGESGCGKTMTALALLGLTPRAGRIDSGRVVLEGIDLVAGEEKAFADVRGKRIGYVAQEPMVALDPSFTVGALLREPLRHHGGMSRRSAHTRALELLDAVGIPRPHSVARSYPHQLSGGMAQRVAIALALSGEPDILIADEPTTALDVTVQAEILELLRTHQQQSGLSLLLVTHDLSVVADSCTRALVMYAGQIVEQGSVDEIFDQPTHPYTAALLQSRPELAQPGERLVTIPGRVPAPRDWPVSCRFAKRCAVQLDQCTSGPIHLHTVSAEHASRCLRTEEILRGLLREGAS